MWRLTITLLSSCKWRAPPSESGNWRTVYARFNQWSKNGTLELVFEGLQRLLFPKREKL
jgi:transposase